MSKFCLSNNDYVPGKKTSAAQYAAHFGLRRSHGRRCRVVNNIDLHAKCIWVRDDMSSDAVKHVINKNLTEAHESIHCQQAVVSDTQLRLPFHMFHLTKGLVSGGNGRVVRHVCLGLAAGPRNRT